MQSICGASLRESTPLRIGVSNSSRNLSSGIDSLLPAQGSMNTLIGGMPRAAMNALATAMLSLLVELTTRNRFSGPPPPRAAWAASSNGTRATKPENDRVQVPLIRFVHRRKEQQTAILGRSLADGCPPAGRPKASQVRRPGRLPAAGRATCPPSLMPAPPTSRTP